MLGAYAASSPFAAGHVTAVDGLLEDGGASALWPPQALAVRHALAPQSRTAAGHGNMRNQALELFGPALEPCCLLRVFASFNSRGCIRSKT